MIELLTNQLPNAVYIGGLQYAINTDFRACLKFEKLMNDDSLSAEDKLNTAFKLFYGKNTYIEDSAEAFEQIIKFYSLGKSIEEIEQAEEGGDILFSFEQDAKYIYSAFREVYNINLNAVSLHWWEFRALFDSLPDNCKFMQILSFRAVKITDEMTDSQKKYYRKMKNIYKLQKNKSIEDCEREFADALHNL